MTEITTGEREELIAEHIPETVTVEIVVSDDFGITSTEVRCDADIDFDQLGGAGDADHRVVMGRLTDIKRAAQDEVGDVDETVEFEGDEHVVAAVDVDRDTLELVHLEG